MFKRARTLTPPPIPVTLRRDQGFWLLAAAAVTLAPHGTQLPNWLFAFCALLLGWRALRLWRGQRPVHRALIMLLSIAACVSAYLAYGYFFGKDPGIALLALLLCLKLLETGAARDIRVAVLLCFFLQLGAFFEDQTFPAALLALLGVLLCLISLLALTDPASGTRERLRTSLTLMAHSLPFMLILFLLFPRLEGPLWRLPADAGSRLTGLSDSMAPGSINKLALSSEIAFRADFTGPPPPPAQRYWRGPVLSYFDGTTWESGIDIAAAAPAYDTAGERLAYRLTLEPHGRIWLLALDFPAPGLPGVRYASDFRALTSQPVLQRTRFELASYPASIVGLTERDSALRWATRLPENSNPRTVALVHSLTGGTAAPEVALQRVLEWLRGRDLVYTLQPPLLGRNSVDEFLFDSRRGFCEHFASAFAFMMRTAGVPTRVVTGYQGGEINPFDGGLIIRQSDAHAWTEVWLTGRGWIRVDPTALVAPGRIDRGLAAALPANEERPWMMRSDLAWLQTLRLRWEAVSNLWDQWVLGYNLEQQRELLNKLGLQRPNWQALAAAIAFATVAVMAALLGWALMQRRRDDPLERAWSAFSAKLARHGLARKPAEGPLDYGHRIADALPRHADVLLDIATSYARLRYRPPATPAEVRALRQRIHTLRLP